MLSRPLRLAVALASIAVIWDLWTQSEESAGRLRIFLTVWFVAIPIYMWWVERSVARLRARLEREDHSDM